MNKQFGLLVIILLSVSSVAFARQDTLLTMDEAYKRVYTIQRLEGKAPVIDGRLNDSIWMADDGWSDPFVQIVPYERAPSESPTYVKLTYDDKYIYVGVKCKDKNPRTVNRFIGNRDDNSIGDIISIAFDTYHDFRAAPEFNINAGGNKTDLIVTDSRDVNLSWNVVWEGRTHISEKDSLWTVEMRIPFSQLRYNHNKADGVWGLHVRRLIRNNNEVQNWSMIPLKNNGHVFSFGELHGLKDLPKPKGIEFLPYVLGKHRREPRIEGSPYQTGSSWKGNIGIDAKASLRDYTLDLTVNPDFGQVELDPSVMNLSAYETFYDEKRPFFLEGKHITDFKKGSDMMFYSRRIGAAPQLSPGGIDNVTSFAEKADNVPIIGAVKLTGTNSHGITIGAVQSLTARSLVRTMRNGTEAEEVVEPLTNYTVARMQKNWKGNTLLGGMITSVNRALTEPYLEDALVRNAFTGGIDFTQYFSNRLYYMDAKVMFSSLNGSKKAITALQRSAVHYYQRESSQDYLRVDPNRTSLNGTGGYFKFGKKGNARWTFSETFNWSSPGFDLNDIGYLRDTDNLRNETEVAFRQTDIYKRFRSLTFTLMQSNKWNYGGRYVGSDLTLRWEAMNLSRMEWDFKNVFGWNSVDSRMLRGGPDIFFDPWFTSTLKFNTDKAKRFMFTFNGMADISTTDQFQGFSLTPGIAMRIGSHLHFSGQFNYYNGHTIHQYVATALPLALAGETSAVKPGYFAGNIQQETYGVTMKVQANITPDLSIQLYAAPFTSIGRFTELKQAVDPLSQKKEERFYTFLPEEVSLSDGQYSVKKGTGPVYQFRNPDFSFNEFRSNLVLRWEYIRGSTLYFVWEHHMSNRDNYYREGWGGNLDRMFALPSYDTFMIKVNYWFSL